MEFSSLIFPKDTNYELLILVLCLLSLGFNMVRNKCFIIYRNKFDIFSIRVNSIYVYYSLEEFCHYYVYEFVSVPIAIDIVLVLFIFFSSATMFKGNLQCLSLSFFVDMCSVN